MTLILSLLTPALLVLAAADEPNADSNKIQGKWEVVSRTFDGRKSSAQDASVSHYIFTPDKMQIVDRDSGRRFDFSFRLDPFKTPRSIDMSGADGKIAPAIYELDGDNLTLCIPEIDAKTRPTKFKADQGSKLALIVLKRVK
jgi:uncharacterized protein (TIGR03067 family)